MKSRSVLDEYQQSMTHEQLDERVRQMCELLNLLHYHTYDSRKSQPGFPDWYIAGEAIYHVENKAGNDTLTADQRKWCFALVDRQPHVHCWVVRANTIDLLDDVLQTDSKPHLIRRKSAIDRLTLATSRELAQIRPVHN